MPTASKDVTLDHFIRKASEKISHRFKYLRYRLNRVSNRSFLPQLSQADQQIVDGLEHEGVHVTTLEALGLGSTQRLLSAANTLLPLVKKAAMTGDKSYGEHAPAEQIMKYPEIISWGLEERLLNIVENYLGVPVAYRGLTFRKDKANGENFGTRFWHQDHEDHRIVKIIVYLNDVDQDGGPFEYIPKRHQPSLSRLQFTHDGRVLDEIMEQAVPRKYWKACTGPAGTAVFADPCTLFHRGRMPTNSDRYTMFFCYNSQRPLHPKACPPMFDWGCLEPYQAGFSPGQKKAISSSYARRTGSIA